MARGYRLPAALVAVGLTAGPAAAQFGGGPPPGPTLPPAFSPYLNLARRGANPAINYFGLVRPQLQTDAAVQRLQNQVTQINPFAIPAGDGEVVTGTPFGFQNYRSYFGNQFSGGGFGAGVPGRGGAGGGGAAGYGGGGGQPNPFAQMRPGAARPGKRR